MDIVILFGKFKKYVKISLLTSLHALTELSDSLSLEGSMLNA